MASDTIQNRHDTWQTLPAWIVSTLFHATLLLAIGLWIDRLPEGAFQAPSRSTVIVLNEGSREGTANGAGENALFEGEQDRPGLADDAADAHQEFIAALPADTESQGKLPQLPSIDGGALADARSASGGALTSAGALTRGGGARGGRPGGASGTGGEAKVSVFGVEGTGHKFVYAFDRSASMDGAPLRAAKYQLIYSLEALDSIHQFQILFFNHRLSLFDLTGGQRRIAFADDRNKRMAAKYVEGISADGGTDRELALAKALSFEPDVVFFLSDADDPMPASEVQEIVQLSQRKGTAINVIEFGRGPNPEQDNFLVQIARQTGGQYAYVDTNHFEK